MLITKLQSEITVGIMIVGQGEGSGHIQKGDVSRQVGLGKNQSEELESIDLCCFMYTG
jgi:hypothetical protein